MGKKLLCLLAVVLLLLSVFAGCGSKSGSSTNSAPAPAASAPKADQSQASDAFTSKVTATSDVAEQPKAQEAGGEEGKGENGASSIVGSGSSAQSVSNAILAQRKIIRNANVSVEVEDFEKAYGQIKTMIGAFGYVQESSIKKEKIYQEGNKEKLITRGTIIVRVDKDKFESTLSDIKGLGLLLDENIKSDDVTDKFFDTESRLRLLKYEQSRLEEYLKKISDPDTIFKTESRLTDIRHEIEGLTGTLRKWNDLVDLSTITINMVEKGLSTIPQAKDNSYLGRLSGGFLGSLKGVGVFFGELLIVLVQSLPVLVVLALLGLAGIAVYRKYFRKLPAKENKSKDVDVE